MSSKKTLLLEFLFQLQMQIYQYEKHGKFNKAKTCQKIYLETFASTVSIIQKLPKQPPGKTKSGGTHGVSIARNANSYAHGETLGFSRRAKPLALLNGETLVEKNNKILIPANRTTPRSLKNVSNQQSSELYSFSQANICNNPQSLQLEFLNGVTEPLWEARFFSTVYGLRTGRSCYDLIIHLQKILQKNSNYFFQFDITRGFEDNSEKCANYLLLPKRIPKKSFIKFNLFNTIFNNVGFNRRKVADSKKGNSSLPNSNLLFLNFFINNFKKLDTEKSFCNILFHKMDGMIYKFQTLFLHFYKLKYNKLTNVKIVRYANQFLFLTPDLPLLKELITTVIKNSTNEFEIKMNQIGHTLFPYEEKISGVNFLNFEIRQIKKNSKNSIENPLLTLISPSRINLQNHLSELKQISQQFSSQSQENFIFALTPKIRAWCNYYRICSNKKVFFYLDYLLFKILWRWACRRHSKKSRRWIKEKYFHSLDDQNWVFCVYQKEPQQFICLPFHAEINLIHYSEVDNEKSPYDSDITYWLNRYT